MVKAVEASRGYHHGNLRDALIDAGVDLARSGGPNAVLLRAVSRAAGVSHNAAYRHFADQEDLLGTVAQRCMTQLSLLMIERMDLVQARTAARRARSRLEAIGRAYVDFALTEPGWFRTAFTSARPHTAAGDVDQAAPNPYALLGAALDDLVRTGVLAPHARAGAQYTAWSAVHGLSSLLLDGPLRELPQADVARAVDAVLAGINRSLG
ncbi:MAG TPA: TetR/AcrR family transcriptional regulator [Jatrophihabitantaceae bacterium]|nr:TetR/AcrR family transcriptional regulator [Jatrophihabitantaceae bacterium]